MAAERPSFIVRGGGPAGLSAAIGLLERGARAALQEREGYPGVMRRTGFQFLENFSRDEDSLDLLARLGIEGAVEREPLHRATLWDDRGLPHPVASDRPFGYLLRRGSEPGALDRALFDRAQALGLGTADASATPHVIATGPVRPDGVAFERHFATDGAHRIWVLFDPRRAPGGYAYLFTHGGRGTFGTAITLDFPRLREHASASWEFFRRLETIPVRHEVQATTFMNIFIPARYEADGALYAGEAAGLQDFLYGLAIRMALDSGLLAARSLLEGTDYTTLVRERFSRRLDTGLVHRFLYERLWAGAFRRGLEGLERGDYREALVCLSRGPALAPLLLPFVRLLWKNRGACPHPLRPHFCRRRAATTTTAGG